MAFDPDKFLAEGIGTYDTALSSTEESSFQSWKQKNAPNDSGNDYDFRGAYKAGISISDNGHWPDTFKKPNHPTFSVESIYAKDRPELAGSWEGEKYIPHKFDPDAFLSGRAGPSSGSIDQEMDWSAKFNGVDYAKNRMSEVDKAGFAKLAKVTDNSADAQKQAITMAYVRRLLPDIPLPVLQKNWPAARQAFAASALGMSDGEVNDSKLYGAINDRVNANLQQHWSTAHPMDRLKMMFGSRGYGDHEAEPAVPIIGAEAAGTKGGLLTIPKMEGDDSFAGLINSTNRVMSSLTTPENVGIAVGTGGLGELAAFAQATRVAVVAKAAQAAAIGSFVAIGAKDTNEAYANAKLVVNDPHSTDAQKTEAIATVVFSGALTAAAAKGTYDLGKGAVVEEGKVGKNGEVEKSDAQVEAENAKKIEAANLLRDSANKAAPEVAQVLTEAAHDTHPHSGNGPQITEMDGGFVVTDAIGNHLDTVKTMEEAKAAIDKANGVSPKTPDEMLAENKETVRQSDMSGEARHETAGIAHRVSEAQGAEAPRGEGINIHEALDEGRKTYSPEKAEEAVAAFEKDPAKGVTRETLVQARLHDEALTRAANQAAETHGENSPQEQAATRAMEDWKARVKPIQTEWAAHGQLQQGETEIDTGTFRGMTRAVRDSVGERKVSEKEAAKQTETIKEHVKAVKEATAEEVRATKEVGRKAKEVAEGEIKEAKPAKKSSVTKYISQRAVEARARIKARLAEGRVQSGLDPADLADHAIVGADYITKGVTEFGRWSKEMVKEFGDYIKPHLQDLFARSKEAVKAGARDAAISDHKAGDKWTPEQVRSLAKSLYEKIDAGMGFDDARHALAKEFDLPVKDITEGLASPKGMREVTDAMYAKAAARRDAITKAKIWVADQKYPGWQKTFREVPRFFFNLATFGHGTAWFTTHASSQIFIPKATGAIIKNLGQAFKMMGLHEAKAFGGPGMGAYHERMMQDLVRDPNFLLAKRAGLSNDPFHFTDEYQNASVVKQFKELGLIGNRGWDGLKLLRQFRFNQEWEALPKNLQTRDMAEILADQINKATGHGNLKGVPKLLKAPFFAPALEASKWEMMFVDPVRDAKTLLMDRKTASPEEIRGAQIALKTGLQLVGTYLSALTLNQAMLSATNSDQKINFTDPLHGGDWLAFKGFGMKGTPLSPLIRPTMYLMQMAHAFWGDRSKYEIMQGDRVGQAYDKTGEYMRSKLAPFWGITADAVTGSDFRGNTMPWNNDPIPKFETRHGAHQFTSGEYVATHMLPIPMEEAAHEVWTEQGIGEAQQAEWLAALRQAFFAGTTGTRVSEDKPK